MVSRRTAVVSLGLGFLAAFVHHRFGSAVFYVYPFLLLWTKYRNETLAAWESLVHINKNIVYPPTPIPEIQAADYSYEVIREATQNFRYPAVVRGLFNNTKALLQWHTREYLPSVLGDFDIPVVRNATVGTLQDDRITVKFADAFYDMYDAEFSMQYLFFPVKSRFTFNGSAAGRNKMLEDAGNDVIRQDLELHRLWPGFGTKQHSTFATGQFVIGKSSEEPNKRTGSDFHCAIGNNWFIQVVGRKRWDFVDPYYSAYMTPLKGGYFNMWTGNKHIAEVQQHIPTRYVVLNPGDVVYNPDWEWHKITNYGGFSIGVPVRELNISLAFQNNAYFSALVLANRLVNAAFGIDFGGFPPATMATEHDN